MYFLYIGRRRLSSGCYLQSTLAARDVLYLKCESCCPLTAGLRKWTKRRQKKKWEMSVVDTLLHLIQVQAVSRIAPPSEETGNANMGKYDDIGLWCKRLCVLWKMTYLVYRRFFLVGHPQILQSHHFPVYFPHISTRVRRTRTGRPSGEVVPTP